MSKDNVKNFFEEIEKNPGMKEKFLGEMTEPGDVKNLISFASSVGFEFSEKDVDELCDDESGNEELADEDIAKAAGGFGCQKLVADYMSSRVFWRCY